MMRALGGTGSRSTSNNSWVGGVQLACVRVGGVHVACVRVGGVQVACFRAPALLPIRRGRQPERVFPLFGELLVCPWHPHTVAGGWAIGEALWASAHVHRRPLLRGRAVDGDPSDPTSHLSRHACGTRSSSLESVLKLGISPQAWNQSLESVLKLGISPQAWNQPAAIFFV